MATNERTEDRLTKLEKLLKEGFREDSEFDAAQAILDKPRVKKRRRFVGEEDAVSSGGAVHHLKTREARKEYYLAKLEELLNEEFYSDSDAAQAALDKVRTKKRFFRLLEPCPRKRMRWHARKGNKNYGAPVSFENKALKEFLNEHPDAATWVDYNKYGPALLRETCYRCDDVDFIRWVFDLYPEESFKVTCKDGTLLDLALKSNPIFRRDAEMTKFLHQKWPEAINVKDEDGRLPLHRAMSHPNSVNLSFEVMEYLIETGGSEAIVAKGHFGWNTLHFACLRMGVRDVELLLQKGGLETLDVVDNEGNLPFHMACQRQGWAKSMIQLLIENGRRGDMKKANEFGELPLHLSCQHHQDYDATFLLADEFPLSLEIPDDQGNLPLHLFCCRDCRNFDVIKLFVRKYPESLRIRDGDGHLPLHLYCQNNPGEREIQLLVHEYPESLRIPDKEGRLPVDIVRASRRIISREITNSIVHWLEDFDREKLDLVYKVVRGLGDRRAAGSAKRGLEGIEPGTAFANLKMLSERWNLEGENAMDDA